MTVYVLIEEQYVPYSGTFKEVKGVTFCELAAKKWRSEMPAKHDFEYDYEEYSPHELDEMGELIPGKYIS